MRVRVKRAGDVIPKVVGLAAACSQAVEESGHVDRPPSGGCDFRMPTSCPVCGSDVAAAVSPSSSARKAIAKSKTRVVLAEGDGDAGGGGGGDESYSASDESYRSSSVIYRCSGGRACAAQILEQFR